MVPSGEEGKGGKGVVEWWSIGGKSGRFRLELGKEMESLRTELGAVSHFLRDCLGKGQSGVRIPTKKLAIPGQVAHKDPCSPVLSRA